MPVKEKQTKKQKKKYYIMFQCSFFPQVLMGKEEQKTPGFSHPQTPTPVFMDLAVYLRDV